MANILARKQEEWNAKQLKELLLLPENKKCFDCPTKSPFFVNISIQTFVCARCSGLVREVGHRVKSISASKFSGPEIVALQYGGNQVAYSIWLSTYRSSTSEPETDGDVRLFMRQKYYEQKWLDRPKAISHSERVKKIITETFTEDGSRRNSVGSTRAQLSPTSPSLPKNISIAPPRQSIDANISVAPPRQSIDTNISIAPPRQSIDTNISIAPPRQSLDTVRQSLDSSVRPKIAATQSWEDDNTPIGLIPSVQNAKNLLFHDLLVETPRSKTQQAASSDIFSELAELNPVKPIKSPTYSGGVLQPHLPTTSQRDNLPISGSVLPSPGGILQPNISSKPISNAGISTQQSRVKSIDSDPFAALRDLSIGSNKSYK